jgi:AcrR family transcriptional regulator
MTEAVVGRRERKKEETKQRIFVSALKLFEEKGFAATTIDDITERADVAKGTFFNYFPRKEAVIEYLAEEWMDEVEEAVADRRLPAAERLMALYKAACRSYEENRELAPLVVRAAMERLCCPAPGGAWQRFESLVLDTVRDGQARGEFRGDADPFAVYGLLASCFLGGTIYWLGPKENAPLEYRDLSLSDVVRVLQHLALDAIRSRPATRGAA